MAKSNGLCTFALPQNQIMGWLKKIFGSKKNDNTGIPPSVETECGNPAEQSNDMIAPAGQLVDVEISAEVELSGTPLVERTREELKPDHHHLERSTPPERSRGAEIPKNMNEIWNDVFFGGRSIGDIIARTSRLNDYGILLEKRGCIDEAIKVYETNVAYGGLAHHSYDRLRILYKKKGDVKNEKRIIELTLERLGKDSKLTKRLNAINGVKQEIFLPKEAHIYTVDGETLGEKFEKTLLKAPEFNFYYDVDDDDIPLYQASHADFSDTKEVKELLRIGRKLRGIIFRAGELEDEGRLDKAAKLYEEVVAHKAFLTAPYDRLVKIYSKANLKEEEERVLVVAISHFKDLRERRKEYILSLATKYGKLDFAQDRVENGQKITYFSGIFDLYSPYTIVEKWEIRLDKLRSKKNKS